MSEFVEGNSEYNRWHTHWLTHLVDLLPVAINVNLSYVAVFYVDTRNAFRPLITRYQKMISMTGI